MATIANERHMGIILIFRYSHSFGFRLKQVCLLLRIFPYLLSVMMSSSQTGTKVTFHYTKPTPAKSVTNVLSTLSLDDTYTQIHTDAAQKLAVPKIVLKSTIIVGGKFY